MWWNGWVFSFEKAPKSTNIDDGGSSGMDEANQAINCLDDSDDFEMQASDQQEFEPQDDSDLIVTFNSLAVSMTQAEHQLGESSSGNSRDRLPLNQPAQPSVSPFAPGPSHTHSVERQDITIPEIVQPLEEEIIDRSQNSKGKAKEKAVDNITEADTQVKKAVAKGKQRGRPKKAI
jgi:hypothetical protein